MSTETFSFSSCFIENTSYKRMKIKERYEKVLGWFQENVPVAETELNYSNPFELLVAVILSAQCTDVRINQITEKLFFDYPTPEAMSMATPEVIFEYIRSATYPNSKAKHLVGMAKMLVEKYNSEIPDTLEELTTLPGVGRKTANVVLSVIFKKPTMAVDTHVFRVANRIGLTRNSKTPLETEKTLVRHIPKELVHIAHHWLILHGRYICTARSPKCSECGIKLYCREFAKQTKIESK